MPTDAGDLKERLRLEQPVEGSNETGETVLTWQLVAEVWGKVAPVTGRELVEWGQVVGTTMWRVTIRYRPGVASKMRILFRGRVLEIGQVLEVDRYKYLQLICTERGT